MCNCNKKSIPGVLKPVQQNITPQHFQKTNKSFTIARLQLKPVFAAKATIPAPLPGETIQDRCLALGDLLGLDGPVSEAVLLAALDNKTYAQRLLDNRFNAGPLYDLLNNPPISLYSASSAAQTNAQLVAKAGKALLRWGFSGFATVSAEVMKTREDACLACPKLTVPARTLQKITASAAVGQKPGQRTGNKICSMCGCVIRNKIRLSTETCPQENPETPGMNLWGEPLAE